MNSPGEHLLTKYKVLHSFNVSKRFKNSYVNNIKRKLKKEGKTDLEIAEELDKKISLSTQKFVRENEIPGFNKPKLPNIVINEKTKKLIVKLAEYCAKYVSKYNFSKEHIILFMQLFLHMTKITTMDVNQFKSKYGLDSSDESDHNDDDSEE